ncbi:MAG: hypothetical protein GY822_25225 [Deltaproteobacteria bacterium]|nr:hypothetical protein [Deltaproteobacteria bacterium]
MSCLKASSPLPYFSRSRAFSHVLVRLVLAGCFVFGALAVTGCTDDDDEEKKPLTGSRPGTERWLVFLKGASLSMEEFRAEKDAAKKAELEKQLRQGSTLARSDFEKRLEEFDGTVVTHWWMTNAVTVEIPSGTDKSVLQIEGVERMSADQPLQ